jgi:sugar lactone lactonase YvrE
VKFATDGRVLAALSTGYTSEYGSAFPSALIGISGFLGNLISALLAGVVVDSRGNVLVATGADLRKLSPTGVPLAIWKPPAGKGYRQQPQQVAVDRLGNIYTSGGATPVQQSPGGGFFIIGFESVDKLSPTGKLLARFGKRGNAPGRFGTPVGLALDAAGNLYVAELANNRVQKLSRSGLPLAIWGDLRTSPPPHGRFGSVIYGFAVGPSGTMFVAAPEPDRVIQLSPAGSTIATWNAESRRTSFSADALTIDREGNVYLPDRQHAGVVELSPRGRLLHHWRLPRSRDSEFGFSNAPQVDDVAVAPSGSIYVAAEGSLWSRPRGPGRWKEIVHGSNSSTARHSVSDLAIDFRGRIYAIDREGVSVFSPTGKQLGRRITAEACAGVTFSPAAIAVGPRGTLYVADADPIDQILKFSSSGHLLARWGSRGDGRYQFHFDYSVGLAVGLRGNLFVADQSERIRKFSPGGKLLATWR